MVEPPSAKFEPAEVEQEEEGKEEEEEDPFMDVLVVRASVEGAGRSRLDSRRSTAESILEDVL